MLLKGCDDLLEALRSWFFCCQKISQQCVRFAADQTQQGWHSVVVIYVVCLEKLFHTFHIGFPFLLRFIKTLYLPDCGHISDVFSTSSSSSPLSCIRFNASQAHGYRNTHKCACSLMSTAGQIHYSIHVLIRPYLNSM